MYFENYLKNKNDSFNHNLHTNNSGIQYEITHQSNINRVHTNPNLPNTHYNYNTPLDPTDQYRNAQQHYPLQHDFRKMQIGPSSPMNSHKNMASSKFQQFVNSNSNYGQGRPQMADERRLINPSPIKINQRVSTSINRQDNPYCRYQRRSQSISAFQPKFGQQFKLNTVSNCTVLPQHHQYQSQQPMAFKNGLNQAQNIKFNPTNPSLQTQLPLAPHNPCLYGHIARKSSNVSNDASTQAITSILEQWPETSTNKQPNSNNSSNKYMKTLTNFNLEKYSNNYNPNTNTDRKVDPNQIDKTPMNTFYQYKKKQVQKLNNSRLQEQDCSLQNNNSEKMIFPSISFQQYKQKQEERINKAKTITDNEPEKQISKIFLSDQKSKAKSQLSQEIIDDQINKNNILLAGLNNQKITKAQLIDRLQNMKEKEKIKQLQIELQQKIKQIYQKNKQIFDKNRQIIQKNKQIQSLSTQINQLKQNRNKNINNISQSNKVKQFDQKNNREINLLKQQKLLLYSKINNVVLENSRIKQSNQKYNKQINMLLQDKQELLTKIRAKQLEFLEKSNILAKINIQLSDNQNKIHELITNLSSANSKNKQLSLQISNKQKQISKIVIILEQNKIKLQESLKKVTKLQESQKIINLLSKKIKQYQNVINQQKLKNNQKSHMVNQLNKKKNQQMSVINKKQNQNGQKVEEHKLNFSQTKKQLQEVISVNTELKKVINQKINIINTLNQNLLDKNNTINKLNSTINNLNMTIVDNGSGINDMNVKIAEFLDLINTMKRQKIDVEVKMKNDEILVKQMKEKVEFKEGQIKVLNKKVQQLQANKKSLQQLMKEMQNRLRQKDGVIKQIKKKIQLEQSSKKNEQLLINMENRLRQKDDQIEVLKNKVEQLQVNKKKSAQFLKEMQNRLKEKDGQIQVNKMRIEQCVSKMQLLDNKVKSLLSIQKQRQVSQFSIQPPSSNSPDFQTVEQRVKNQLLEKISQQTDKTRSSCQKTFEDKQIQVYLPQLQPHHKCIKEQVPMVPKPLFDQLQRRFQQISRELKKVGTRLNIVTIQLRQSQILNIDLNEQLIIINALNTNEKYRHLQQLQEQ